MAGKQFSGWDWFRQSHQWMEKITGTEAEVRQWVAERYTAARKYNLDGAAYCATPSGDGPRQSPQALGIDVVRIKADPPQPATTGRYVIWVNGTPLRPENPLNAQAAAEHFLDQVEDGGEAHVEIRVAD